MTFLPNTTCRRPQKETKSLSLIYSCVFIAEHQFTYGASASRLPSRRGGREPVSIPRRLRSGVRTLTNRGPAAFLAPSSQIPLASTCLVPASSFCGRSFQTRKTSIRLSSRAAEPPGARVTLYGSEFCAYCVLLFS